MLMIPEDIELSIQKKLKILYPDKAVEILNEIKSLFNEFIPSINNVHTDNSTKRVKKLSHEDVVLISYADSIQNEENSPLNVLKNFSDKFLKGIFNGLHILPFYPWDTDRGFSVLDYYSVDQRNGTWKDIKDLKDVYNFLMFDCVLNHCSVDNDLVQRALTNDPNYRDYVISFNDEEKPSKNDILKIIRARPTPVLTKFYTLKEKDDTLKVTLNKPETIENQGWLWTTFSRPDNVDGTVATRQVDVNYSNPQVFLEFIKILLFYISMGASWIRLDAIGYLWKKLGTSCLHLEETHLVIQLLKEIFDLLDNPITVLIAEVNEPQNKALEYLERNDIEESDMIYLFTHFPLAVHAILTGTSSYYQKWIESLKGTKGRLFNSILGTHDGMGMKPIGNWLPEEEKLKLQQILIENHGTLPNYARLPGGKKIVYELCGTPWNYINPPKGEETDLQIAKYLAVVALGLSIKSIPAIYINGLLGIPNNEGDLDENRTINRQILNESYLNQQLTNEDSLMFKVYTSIKYLIKIRTSEKAFDPEGEIIPVQLSDSIISFTISSNDKKSNLLVIINLQKNKKTIELNNKAFKAESFYDLINKSRFDFGSSNILDLHLNPYQVYWLKYRND